LSQENGPVKAGQGGARVRPPDVMVQREMVFQRLGDKEYRTFV
jgi:hypothetical protein